MPWVLSAFDNTNIKLSKEKSHFSNLVNYLFLFFIHELHDHLVDNLLDHLVILLILRFGPSNYLWLLEGVMSHHDKFIFCSSASFIFLSYLLNTAYTLNLGLE